MSRLLLVRHGQATLDGDDYDHLSPLGFEQAGILGRYWADLGLQPDRVLVGPRLRHRQTFEAVRAVFLERGLPWPEEEDLEALDEHQGPEILVHHRHRLEEELRASGRGSETIDSENPMRHYLRLFRQGSVRWARGELPTPEGFEDWQGFRRRVDGALDTIRRSTEGSRIVAAFTSGGAASAAVGHALGLDDEAVMRLGWQMRNGAVNELLFSGRGFGLAAFNSVPHFREPRLLTLV